MKKFVRYLWLIIGALFIINLFVVPMIEPGMIYYPSKEIGRTPSSIGLKYEDVYLKTADGVKINGWFVENKASNKVILHFHGNGGNLSNRLPVVKLLHDLPANIFIIDYHGYGISGGKPSEKNLYLDALASYNYLVKQKNYVPDDIIIMGSSIGGAVATYLAARERVGGVVLLRTFTSIGDMAPRVNPIYRWPIVWLRSKFNSLARISKIKAPLLIVHSKKDNVIPYQMSEALCRKANQPKKLLLLERGGHNDIISTPEYLDSLRQMLK